MKLTKLEKEFIGYYADGLYLEDTTCCGLMEIHSFPLDSCVGERYGWDEDRVYVKTKASLKKCIRKMIQNSEDRCREENRALAIATTIDSQSVAASALRAEGWESSSKSNRKDMRSGRSPIQLWYKSLN